MPVCEANRAKIYYELSGLESGPVLIFCNSLGAKLEMWDGQAKALGGKFRILRYDSRGHGRSEVTPGPYTIGMLAEDVLGLAKELGIEQAHFCGLSLGGMVGQWLGANAPRFIEKLVICNTAAKIGTGETWNQRIEAVRNAGMGPLAPGQIERWLTADFRIRRPDEAEKLSNMLRACSVEGYIACCVALRDADLRLAAAAISVPTLVIYGEHDPVVGETEAKFLAECIPDCRLAKLPAAHLSNIEAAEQFNAEVERFLGSEQKKRE